LAQWKKKKKKQDDNDDDDDDVIHGSWGLRYFSRIDLCWSAEKGVRKIQ
jgi:hypothetical protein